MRTVSTLHPAGPAVSGQALLFIDLDRFQRVSDTLGHAAGDTLPKVASGLWVGPGGPWQRCGRGTQISRCSASAMARSLACSR